MGGIADSMDVSVSKLLETVKDRGTGSAAACGAVNSRARLSIWPAVETVGAAESR